MCCSALRSSGEQDILLSLSVQADLVASLNDNRFNQWGRVEYIALTKKSKAAGLRSEICSDLMLLSLDSRRLDVSIDPRTRARTPMLID